MSYFSLLDQVVAGRRLEVSQAVELLRDAPWTALVQAAHAVRLAKNTPSAVGYAVYRIVNYTNVCDVDCSFCSFMRRPGDPEAYVTDLETMRQKAREAQALGADEIFFQGGVHAGLPLTYYTEALALFRDEFGMPVRGFSPVELLRMSKVMRLPLPELLGSLKEAGLTSVPGAGAEIMTERMRKILAPRKLSAADWCRVMGECHLAGLPGSANIVIGSCETPEDVVQHLAFIRDQQDLTGGFLSFVPWVFQPQTSDFPIRHVSGPEYLKTLALSRLFFDNIDHIEVSVLGMGESLGELGLYAGGDDINSIVIEENVMRSQGLRSIADAERFIGEAGFVPRRRRLNFD